MIDMNIVKPHLPAVVEFLQGLVPGALGAAVAVAVQGAMPWVHRFLQLTVGIVVSYYGGQLAAAMFDISDMVRSAVGFVAGIGAFESAKNLRVSMGDVAKRAPGDAWDWWKDRWTALFGGGAK